MELNLEGKNVLITGGSKGIGKGIAMALAEEGCNVSICARHSDELETTADELLDAGGKVLTVQADLTDKEAIEKVVDETKQAFGSIDILVNNAGTVGQSGTLEDTPLREWREVFELNLFAIVTITRKVIPAMKEQGWRSEEHTSELQSRGHLV